MQDQVDEPIMKGNLSDPHNVDLVIDLPWYGINGYIMKENLSDAP